MSSRNRPAESPDSLPGLLDVLDLDGLLEVTRYALLTWDAAQRGTAHDAGPCSRILATGGCRTQPSDTRPALQDEGGFGRQPKMTDTAGPYKDELPGIYAAPSSVKY